MESLNERDIQYVDILTGLGIKRHVAKAAIFLCKAKSATSREVELGADLRQPEVSIAMKELKALNWTVEREIKKKGKGRPLKSYDINITLPEIVSYLEKEKSKECDERKSSINRLKEMINQVA